MAEGAVLGHAPAPWFYGKNDALRSVVQVSALAFFVAALTAPRPATHGR
jgi:hypothetical protein